MKILKWLIFTFLLMLTVSVTFFAYEAYRANSEIVGFWKKQPQGLELSTTNSDFKKFVVYFSQGAPDSGNCELECLFIKISQHQLSRKGNLRKRPNWFANKFIYKFLPWWYSKEEMARLSFNHIHFFSEKGKDSSLNSIYGYPSAAKFYFKKSFENLEAHEISSLMAISWLGSRSKNSEALEQTRNKILAQMRERQLIGDEVYNRQLENPVLNIE